MNKKSVIASVLALCLSIAGSAYAQPGHDRSTDRRNDHGRHEQAQRGGPGHGPALHSNSRHNQPHAHAHAERRGDWRGAGPRHDMRKGQRLSREYRSRHYVVNDWRGRRLSPPPRGYHWVQTGTDYVLVAIATGIIVQLVLN